MNELGGGRRARRKIVLLDQQDAQSGSVAIPSVDAAADDGKIEIGHTDSFPYSMARRATSSDEILRRANVGDDAAIATGEAKDYRDRTSSSPAGPARSPPW
jgi:hypothetical protein